MEQVYSDGGSVFDIGCRNVVYHNENYTELYTFDSYDTDSTRCNNLWDRICGDFLYEEQEKSSKAAAETKKIILSTEERINIKALRIFLNFLKISDLIKYICCGKYKYIRICLIKATKEN